MKKNKEKIEIEFDYLGHNKKIMRSKRIEQTKFDNSNRNGERVEKPKKDYKRKNKYKNDWLDFDEE